MDSINVQARLDICTLATLARAYREKEDSIIRSKSDLLWKAVEQVASLYVEAGAERFTDVYEALAYLDKIGLSLDSSKRTKRQVQSAMVRQNASSDFGVGGFQRVTKRQVQIAQDELSQQRELYQYAVSLGLKMSFEEYIVSLGENHDEKTTDVDA